MKKIRLDLLLAEKGMVESRSQAQRYIMAGEVRVDGQLIIKPATVVRENATITIDQAPKFVSRGGDKLDAALQYFKIGDLSRYICADAGASTGGFTDCLLQYGAQKVYAIDVGHNILHWKLRKDPRVIVLEDTNARYVSDLPEPVDLVTVDVSFISLGVVLPVLKQWLKSSGGIVIALIKPQFEAGRKEAARGKGVIRDTEVHRSVIKKVLVCALKEGFGIKNLMISPVIGPKGNIEFLAHLLYPNDMDIDLDVLVSEVLGDSPDSLPDKKNST